MVNKTSLQITPNQCPQCKGSKYENGSIHGNYKIIQCSLCGLTYAWPREVPPGLYDKAYDSDGEYSEYITIASNLVIDKMHLTWAMRRFLNSVLPNGNLLDIGCSTGTFLKAALEKGWQGEGIEISDRAANICREITKADVFAGTLENFSPDKKYDAITAWEVMEHIPDPVIFLNKAYSLLNEGGVIGMSVPNWASPWMKNSKHDEHWPPFHLTFWNSKTLNYLLANLNFKNIEIAEKPFAWEEEVGRLKWPYLPIAIFRSLLMHHKGMHIFAKGEKIL